MSGGNSVGAKECMSDSDLGTGRKKVVTCEKETQTNPILTLLIIRWGSEKLGQAFQADVPETPGTFLDLAPSTSGMGRSPDRLQSVRVSFHQFPLAPGLESSTFKSKKLVNLLGKYLEHPVLHPSRNGWLAYQSLVASGLKVHHF